MAGLSPKRQRFVDEYLIDSNGTQAAIRAGYSPKTANEQAAQLLAIPSVKEAVSVGRQAIADRNAITQDKIRQELSRVGFAEDLQQREKVRALELLGKDLGMFGDALLAKQLEELERTVARLGIGTELPGKLNGRAFFGRS